MLHALSNVTSAMSKGTKATMDDVAYFLNYCASNSNVKLRYRASDMNLHDDSDATCT